MPMKNQRSSAHVVVWLSAVAVVVDFVPPAFAAYVSFPSLGASALPCWPMLSRLPLLLDYSLFIYLCQHTLSSIVQAIGNDNATGAIRIGIDN